jgi:asparagine synthase (glutamine-hydrolysing)
MCGLAGILDWSKRQDISRVQQDFPGVSADIYRRGPDDSVLVADEHMTSVHARLSIVGGAAGDQPIVSEDENKYALFVGEVYNWQDLAAPLRTRHRFGTRSDGEVLLHGYEEEGLHFFRRVDGMFALAIRDLKHNQLLLARDRLGIKPLFWAMEDQRIAFGTDVKSVNHLLGRRSALAWRRAFQMIGKPAHYPGPCWLGVEEIAPGTAVVFMPDQAPIISRWYEFSYCPGQGSEKEVEAMYRAALTESVARQTQGIDRLAIALSGGLDSSILCSLSKEKPTTFVLVNASTVDNGELDAARLVAEQLEINLHEVVPQKAGNATRSAYLDILRFCESPDVRAEHLLKNELAQMADQMKVRVLLSGQGSDEFNGGYSGIVDTDGQTSKLATYLQQTIEADFYPQLLIANGIRPDLAKFINWTHVDFLDETVFSDLWEQELHRRLHILRRYNLWLEDRIAARFGIENRVPFLGNKVLDLTWSIPRVLQKPLLSNKEILRRIATELLPEQIVKRVKIPFFHGRSAGSTFRYLSEVLFFEEAGSESLVSMAGQSQALSGNGFLDPQSFTYLALLVQKHPDHEAVEALAGLVNLALLAEPGFLHSQESATRPIRICWFSMPLD